MPATAWSNTTPTDHRPSWPAESPIATARWQRLDAGRRAAWPTPCLLWRSTCNIKTSGRAMPCRTTRSNGPRSCCPSTPPFTAIPDSWRSSGAWTRRTGRPRRCREASGDACRFWHVHVGHDLASRRLLGASVTERLRSKASSSPPSLNARNAMDSGRTSKRAIGQHGQGRSIAALINLRQTSRSPLYGPSRSEIARSFRVRMAVA